MADTEISNLVELSGASLADGDPIAIVDASASETKKITAKNFLQSGVSLIDDGSIPAAKVASVGTSQLDATSVTSTELATDAVTTAKIQDSAVTNAKVASGIDGAKLSNSSVAANKLGTVTDRGLIKQAGVLVTPTASLREQLQASVLIRKGTSPEQLQFRRLICQLRQLAQLVVSASAARPV